MKRLLCLISGMNAGGAETFLMKIYRKLDRQKYQIDFCINVKDKCFYEDEITSLGGKIYRIPSKSENVKQFKKQLTEIIKNGLYERVLRITSSAMGFMDLKVAKKAGAKVCCARSSNSSDAEGLKAKICHRLGKLFYGKYVDVKIAPSDLAAIYTFGKKAYRRKAVNILRNGVDIEIFKFSQEGRIGVRNEFSVKDDEILLGHVGRFDEQKNHTFLIDVFNQLYRKDKRLKLLLVGKGKLENLVKQKVESLGLADRVIFSGVRKDVPNVYSAMDLFVFPSLYEGMPNTVIEAQATGLRCVISDTITKQANVGGIVEYVKLNDLSQWVSVVSNQIPPASEKQKPIGRSTDSP